MDPPARDAGIAFDTALTSLWFVSLMLFVTSAPPYVHKVGGAPVRENYYHSPGVPPEPHESRESGRRRQEFAAVTKQCTRDMPVQSLFAG